MVIGVMVAPATVAFGGGGVEFAEGGASGVPQHMASATLDEPGAVSCDYEFRALAEHKYSLLACVLDDGVGVVYDGYEDSAGGTAKDVGGVLLPVRGHAEEGRGQCWVATDFFVQVVVIVPATVSI